MAMIQIKLARFGKNGFDSMTKLNHYIKKPLNDTFELLQNKNHDYAEAWRDMRVSSMTDIILMKLLRVKQIEDNKGKTSIKRRRKSKLSGYD
jgi:hypothetical protein